VELVHDVHVWSIKPGKICMTAHIKSSNIEYSLNKATKVARQFGIYHSVIQSESSSAIDKCRQNIHM
jgi:solute carrier family 30 (zinc transporter), member 2